jgi:hypothetical protein
VNAEQLHQLFLQYPNIRALFAGHNHLFNKYEEDGMVYIMTGGGGGWRSTSPPGSRSPASGTTATATIFIWCR